MGRSGFPPPRRATSLATSSTSISDQCPTWAVYEGVENLPAGQPAPSASTRERVPWRPAVTGATTVGTPVGIGMLHPLLGEVIAITEIVVAITVIAVALFGSQALSERAFRLLRWFGNRSEPAAPR